MKEGLRRLVAGGLTAAALSSAGGSALAAENDNNSINTRTSVVDKLDGVMPSARGLENLSNTVSNKEVSSTFTFDTEPVISNGHIYLPMRAVNDALGGLTDWKGDSDIQTATFTKGNNTLILYKNKKDNFFSKTVSINGVKKTYDYDPAIIDLEHNRTLGSVRLMGEGEGMGVDWLAYPLNQAVILDSGTDGKVVTLTLNSKEGKMEQNTYLNLLKRAAFFANPTDREELLSLIKSNTGPIEPPVSVVDSKTKAQINFLNNDYSNRFQTEAAMMTDYNSKFGSVGLTKDNTVYVYPDKLAIYTGTTKKNVEVYNAVTKSLQEIDSTSDIIVSYAGGKLIVTNTEGSTYNLDTRQWQIDVTKTPEYIAAKQTVVDNLNYAYNEIKGYGNTSGDIITYDNGFGLDKSEIDRYAQTGSCEGFKTFQVLNQIGENGNLEPGLIMVTGQFGIKHTDLMKQGIDWLNSVDPTLVRSLSKTTKYIASDLNCEGIFWKYRQDYWATYFYENGSVFIQDPYVVDAVHLRKSSDFAMIYFVESEAIIIEQNGEHGYKTVENRKREICLNWLNQNKSKISPDVYKFWESNLSAMMS